MMFRQFFLAAILSVVGLTALAQDTKTYYNIPDDGYAIVPIPFGFPFYGRVFTHSIFFDNGLVSFYDPQTEGMRLGGQNFFAQPLSNNIGSNFHYSIMPLWTDLRNYSGSYYTETDSKNYLRYNWENISQFGYPDRLNSFSLEIRPTGYIGIDYQNINIGGYPITVGTVGNAQLGEWNQYYYKSPSEFATLSSIQNWNIPYTQGLDCSDASLNSYCPGYTETVFTQQCILNPLYDTTCPGYALSYYNYQCDISSLFHTGCVGYAQAYFEQQCTLDALYSNQCSGYSEAYAKKYILDVTPVMETVSVENEVIEQDVVIETQEVIAVTESVTAPTVSASPSTEATSPVTLVASPSSTATTTTTTERKTESKSSTTTSSASSASKNQPTTTRQALAQRRMEAAREQAAESAKENPDAISEQMDSAASMEQQVELQNVVLGAMGFVAGFDAYGRVVIPDAVGYKPFTIYNNQTNVDNARMLRGLTGASDRLHDQMVDQQYR